MLGPGGESFEQTKVVREGEERRTKVGAIRSSSYIASILYSYECGETRNNENLHHLPALSSVIENNYL